MTVNSECYSCWCWRTGLNLQFILDPPPTARAHDTTGARPNSALLGLPTLKVSTLLSGVKFFKNRAGCMCWGKSFVWGPVSSIFIKRHIGNLISREKIPTKILNVGSAAARRPAVTQAAAPPSLCLSTCEQKAGFWIRTSCEDDVVYMHNGTWGLNI